MAYDNGKDGYSWLGVYHPPIPATAVYCDTCAHAGAVPFDLSPCHNPACENETAGGTVMGFPPLNPECASRQNPYRIHQAPPWRWSPAGWDRRIDETPCSGCGKPAASGVPFWTRGEADCTNNHAGKSLKTGVA